MQLIKMDEEIRNRVDYLLEAEPETVSFGDFNETQGDTAVNSYRERTRPLVATI